MLCPQPHDRIGALLEVTVASVHVHHGSVDGLAGFQSAIKKVDGGIGGLQRQVSQIMAEGIVSGGLSDKVSWRLETLGDGRTTFIFDLRRNNSGCQFRLALV